MALLSDQVVGSRAPACVGRCDPSMQKAPPSPPGAQHPGTPTKIKHSALSTVACAGTGSSHCISSSGIDEGFFNKAQGTLITGTRWLTETLLFGSRSQEARNNSAAGGEVEEASSNSRPPPTPHSHLFGSCWSCLFAHPVPSLGTITMLGSFPLFSDFRLGRFAGGGMRRAVATFPRLCKPCRGITAGGGMERDVAQEVTEAEMLGLLSCSSKL